MEIVIILILLGLLAISFLFVGYLNVTDFLENRSIAKIVANRKGGE
jgi:hypothetical protein